jgi:predicted nucleic acid-binding protein
MAKALLDTDILSEVLRGKNDAVRRSAEVYLSQHGQLTISVLSILEVVKGFERLRRHSDLDQFLVDLGSIEVLPLMPEAAVLAGRMYGALERTGQPIGRIDPMIAATAATHNLELVSGNRAHYERLIDLEFPLRLTNWRDE